MSIIADSREDTLLNARDALVMLMGMDFNQLPRGAHNGIIQTLTGVCEAVDSVIEEAGDCPVSEANAATTQARAVPEFLRSTDRQNLEQFGAYHDCQIDMLRTLSQAINAVKDNPMLAQSLATISCYLADHFESDSAILVRRFLEDADWNAEKRGAL